MKGRASTLATNVVGFTAVAEQRLTPMAKRVDMFIVRIFVESERYPKLKQRLWLLVPGYWYWRLQREQRGV